MRNLYRFEIVRELGRDGGNAVYEVHDPLNAVTLHLLEWTPSSSEWSNAAARLFDVGDVPDGEVFSNRSSFYLAVAPAKVDAALEALRARSLFGGSWPGAGALTSAVSAVATVGPRAAGNAPVATAPLAIAVARPIQVCVALGVLR